MSTWSKHLRARRIRRLLGGGLAASALAFGLTVGATGAAHADSANSGLCLTADGVAGDGVYQLQCAGAPQQKWIMALAPSAIGATPSATPPAGPPRCMRRAISFIVTPRLRNRGGAGTPALVCRF